MLYIHCPHCGEVRDESEYACAGEAFIARPAKPDQISDAEWGDYLFCRTNSRGIHFEQWQHLHGCRKFFVVKRNTVNNHILATGTFTKMRAGWLQARKKSKAAK